jgi:hypothetical protein
MALVVIAPNSVPAIRVPTTLATLQEIQLPPAAGHVYMSCPIPWRLYWEGTDGAAPVSVNYLAVAANERAPVPPNSTVYVITESGAVDTVTIYLVGRAP